MKWGNVSERHLPAYKAFVDVFLNDPAAQFIWMRVDRGGRWRYWENNRVARFFKSYWFFLKANMSTFSRYGVYLDNGPFKRYRYSSVRFAANKGAARSQVHTLEPVDSKRDVLIQLVDVLLGSVSSQAKAPAKVSLAHHVAQAFGATKMSWTKGPKFLAYEWSPYEEKVEVELS